ncbi:MAG: hypothetical protein ACLFVU_00210, partial [Phycisphaerae bacterium]
MDLVPMAEEPSVSLLLILSLPASLSLMLVHYEHMETVATAAHFGTFQQVPNVDIGIRQCPVNNLLATDGRREPFRWDCHGFGWH